MCFFIKNICISCNNAILFFYTRSDELEKKSAIFFRKLPPNPHEISAYKISADYPFQNPQIRIRISADYPRPKSGSIF